MTKKKTLPVDHGTPVGLREKGLVLFEVIGDWVDALTEQYGQDGLPPWDRYEAAIALIEQAQQLLMPERRLRLVT